MRFFAGEPDDAGRTLDGIVCWPDAQLEAVHDYIQWLFPLPERSGANPWAPVLTPASIAALRASPEAQARLHAAWRRMLAFYGLVLDGEEVVPGPEFQTTASRWLTPGDHNHLRLTRMLRSLRVLGCEAEAQALWAALRRLHETESAAGRHSIADETVAYWRRAATEPLDAFR